VIVILLIFNLLSYEVVKEGFNLLLTFMVDLIRGLFGWEYSQLNGMLFVENNGIRLGLL
jgi:hypothetical protein